jgi:DNA helicase-2/ATP-dependent DNA helicase PcrA
LEQEGRKQNLSMWDVIVHAVEQKTFAPRTLNALTEFRNMIQEFMQQSQEKPASELIRWMMEKSGYVQSLEAEGSEEALSRIENLQELVNAARDSEERGESFRDFLDHAALVSDTDDYDERSRVTLMTLHSAKGLEFPLVFIVGLEEGLFPHSRSSADEKEIEEERRLCYVGMTRAQRKLFLTRAKFRRFLGGESFNQTEPSRFIREIPPDLIQHISEGQGVKRAVVYDGPTYNTAASIKEFYKQRGKQVDLAPVKREESPRGSSFKYGAHVRHAQYGVGMIVRCEGEGEDTKLTVSFPGYGLKKLIQKYAKLERV